MHQAHCHCPACGAAAFEVLEFGRRNGASFEAEIAGASGSGTCTQKFQGLSVAVVGGGFAGLMAARTLCRADTLIDMDPSTRGKPVALTSRPVVVRADGKVVYGAPSVERFDHVVFAIPPSVWGEVTFKPAALHPATAIGVMETGDAVMEGALRSGERAAELLMAQVCKQPEVVARVA